LEVSSSSYPERTNRNVRESDGTSEPGVVHRYQGSPLWRRLSARRDPSCGVEGV
jgi:hypothetical protein